MQQTNRHTFLFYIHSRSRRSTSGSRTSLLSEQSAQQLQAALKVPERDPESRAVEFVFKFRGFRADLHSGETPLNRVGETRAAETALARVEVKLLAVSGNVLLSSAIFAQAYLENCLLEDNRLHNDGASGGGNGNSRIVRLMEAKQRGEGDGSNGHSKRTRMIDIEYNRDPEANQKVDITIYSFVLVGSVPYLMEIANFFVQDQEVKYEWGQSGGGNQGAQGAVATAGEAPPGKISLFVKIEEPDIFLVENIDNVDTDALMLTTELQFKFWTAEESLSMMASLTNVRCHTCRFNPAHREETMAQILQPCTLSFTASRTQGHGMRINANISDLCLNVSPHGIVVVQKSVQAVLDSMSKAAEEAAGEEGTGARKSSLAYDSHGGLWKPRHFEDDEFWFLKAEESVEAVEALDSLSSGAGGFGAGPSEDEQAIININNLVVKLESGVGNNTIPMLLLESSFSCDVRNWSGPRMSAIGSMDLEVAYYNSKLALWEPVVEPVCQVNRFYRTHQYDCEAHVL